jgi:nucleotide-binding universal stress UspA family protein
MPFERILIAVDESPVSAHAADVGVGLASALSAKLAFVLVVDPSAVVAVGAGVPAEEIFALARREAEGRLAAFWQRLAPPTTPLQFVRTGAPAAEIVKAAAEWPADLVVVGSHGRSAISRALLGNVAEAVTRHAPCPVLVVRPRR